MAKIHTRIKRRCRLSTTRRHYHYFHGSGKKHRPKTFKTEEAANAWALKHGLKPGEHNIKKVKHNKKFQILFIQSLS